MLAATGGALLFGASSLSSAEASTVSIGPGSNPLDIRALKLLLRGAGVSSVVVNGTFDSTFTAQLIAYQKSHGLAATGRGDDATTAYLGSRVAVRVGTTSNHASAARVLLFKHGYTHSSGAAGTYYGTSTVNTQLMRDLTSFRIMRGAGYSTYPIEAASWTALFRPAVRVPGYPMLQQGTGSAQWNNCGPTAAMTILLSRGIQPAAWTGNAYLYNGVAQHGGAVRNFRYIRMGMTTAQDGQGTEFSQFQKAFATYGITAWHGGINDTIAAARQGVPSICGGDAGRLPYTQNVKTGSRLSHWLTVLGRTPAGYFIIADPLCLNTASSDRLHTISETQLRTYASSNTGGSNPPSFNSVMFR
ncbi:hypothetical protein GCM10027579_12060 [Calidifontibacter terrae]